MPRSVARLHKLGKPYESGTGRRFGALGLSLVLFAHVKLNWIRAVLFLIRWALPADLKGVDSFFDNLLLDCTRFRYACTLRNCKIACDVLVAVTARKSNG